jgi:N-acetylglucosaminyl-diphospho-decaprenol L-rhamnosyltransferase
MANEQAPDLSIIIVSWHVRDLLRTCLASLQAGSGVTTEVIVIDNASADGSAEMVAHEYPAVHLIRNPDNRGFTQANNQGLALCRGRYVLFLNPDTQVVGDALRTMVSYMDAHPETGALGPQLRFGDGTPQSSRRRFPTFAVALFESSPVAWHWPNNRWARWYHLAEQPDDCVQTVDWVVGAALLARRAVLDQIGGFDEGYFMYSEELDWCRRAVANGWQIVYLPTALIIHHEGKSSEQAVAARHIHFQTSKVRYFRKFHGPLPATILRLLILATFAMEWILEGLKWLAGSRRSLRMSRLKAYGQLLRSGLC